MHILIIEATLSGHHSGYLDRIASGYLDDGHFVTITVARRDVSHPVLVSLMHKFSNALNIVTLDDAAYDNALRSKLGEPGREIYLRRLFKQAYQNIHFSRKVDYVFLPYLDYCLYAIGLMGSPFGTTKWGGICMRPSFHYEKYDVVAPAPKMATVKRYLFKKILQNESLRCLYSIDELLCKYVTEFNSRLSKKVCYLPDPVEVIGEETYCSAREKLRFNSHIKVILVYGSLDERKGLVELTNFLVRNPHFGSIQLLVVGVVVEAFKFSDGYKNILKLVEQGRCIFINKYIDKFEEQCVFAASDVVWLGYKNHYSMSGVLVISALAGKPVIATEQGLIGWYARRHSLGINLDVCNSNKLFDIMNDLNEGKFAGASNTKASADFLVNHSWGNFLSIIKLSDTVKRET